VLELVELPGKEDRSPNQLSGGEKQRVALARALVLEPAVLLLDEPLGALDQKLRKQMQVELKRLHERLGITFIFVTHDEEEALVMSDRVAVLNRGRLEQLGTGEDIYERPGTRWVAEFMGVENFIDARCVARQGGASRFETPAGQTLWADLFTEVGEGAHATLAVRPEALRLSLALPHPPPANLLMGEVAEAIYEGGTRRWVIELPTGARLVARDSNSAATAGERITRGSIVCVWWERARSLVYPVAAGREPANA
jgi:ABC-type Fe3+/spermidine/putrescine transport system ATPase subunit